MFHQGRARRHHGFDRRLKKPLPKIQEPAVEEVTDVLPTPPRADVRDALQAREPPPPSTEQFEIPSAPWLLKE